MVFKNCYLLFEEKNYKLYMYFILIFNIYSFYVVQLMLLVIYKLLIIQILLKLLSLSFIN